MLIRRLSSIQYPLFDVEDLLGAPAGVPNDLSKEDIVLELGKDDDGEYVPDDSKGDKGEKKESKGKDKETKESLEESEEEKDDEDEDDELDELAEIEEELEGPTEEQLELMTPVRRRDILKKYPNFFKEFPYMERAYYREQQFTELLPTIEDARKAVQKSNTLDRFETELVDGNLENVLGALKKTDSHGFDKLVDNYLPNLAKVDERAYHHVIGNIVKQTVMTMVREGKATADKDGNSVLINAASVLYQYVFGSSQFEAPKNLAGDKPKDDDKVNQKEQEFNKKQLTAAQSELTGRVENVIKNTIANNIDPKKSMSDYVRRNAERDALETVQKLMGNDSRFRTILDKLWERAFQQDYSKSSLDAIKSACHSKAKTLLPAVIKKARNEALRGTGVRVKKEKEDDSNEESNTNRESTPRNRGRNDEKPKAFRFKDAKELPKNMSTLELLNLD